MKKSNYNPGFRFLIFAITILAIAFGLVLSSCSAHRYGCKSTWNMAGYNNRTWKK